MSATGSASVSVCVCECECELVQKPNVLSIQRFANNFAVHFQGNDCLPPKKVPNKNWDFLEFNQYHVARHLSSSICFSPFFFHKCSRVSAEENTETIYIAPRMS